MNLNNLTFRRLNVTDYDKGYYLLLSRMTPEPVTGTRAAFNEFVLSLNDTHSVLVLEDPEKGCLVAMLTYMLQTSPLHSVDDRCGRVIHMDHWVADPSYKGAGSFLMTKFTEYVDGLSPRPYKISTTCGDKMKAFYEKRSYRARGHHMCLYK